MADVARNAAEWIGLISIIFQHGRTSIVSDPILLVDSRSKRTVYQAAEVKTMLPHRLLPLPLHTACHSRFNYFSMSLRILELGRGKG